VRLRTPVPPAELAEVVAGAPPPEDRPDRIVVVDDLPRGPIGKVLKRELRERYAAAPVPA
jgi:acyl-CoA synthetase (AMP-forming)/AMP-acid ligase II